MQQEQIIQKINQGKSLFITGGAGSGKSHLLKQLKVIFGKKIALTASTGVAAINIGGMTVHSFAKLGIGKDSLQKIIGKIEKDEKASRRLKNTKIIAIDEISMLSAHFLSLLDEVLKAVRKNEEPFGGTIMLFFGDFLQLPPVIREEWDGICLHSASWNALKPEVILLQNNYRQKDDIEFFNLLSNIRLGKNINHAYEVLQQRVGLETNQNTIFLVSHKVQAFEINNQRLNKLQFAEQIFKATFSGKEEFVKMYLPQFEENMLITLKKGARVMLTWNLSIQDSLCNGSIGTVVDFNQNTNDPIVIFDSNPNAPIIVSPNAFLIEDEFTNEVLFSFTQIPLVLAYGITIHKSQGLTFENIKTDIIKCFAEGQAYVCLSRSKSLNGLFLNSFNKYAFKFNQQLVKYYEALL